MHHYYHFAAENILAGFGALAMAGAAPPRRLVIPWEDDWHDKWGMNDMVASGIFTEPGATVGQTDFAWLSFEQSECVAISSHKRPSHPVSAHRSRLC